MKKRVDIFCSSSDEVSPMFFSEIEQLARGLAKNSVEIVYGGACLGLMGHMADAALAQGGRVIGVIPEYLNKEGVTHSGLTELVVVPTLMDRKRKMAQLADYAIAFPGGIGTIDEISEILALKQLGEWNKPILFHNFLNFWDPFFNFMGELQEQGMIRQPLEDLFRVFDSSQEIVDFIGKH